MKLDGRIAQCMLNFKFITGTSDTITRKERKLLANVRAWKLQLELDRRYGSLEAIDPQGEVMYRVGLKFYTAALTDLGYECKNGRYVLKQTEPFARLAQDILR